MNTTPKKNPKNILELNNLNQKPMNYRQLNEALKNLNSLRNSGKRVERVIEKEIGEESSQGDEGISYEVYKSPVEGIFIKLKITTDSYGNNDHVAGIEFVTPKEKTVTSYEPIN